MAGSLEFIKSVEVTTSVSFVDVTDCFSDVYDVYKITTSGFTTVSTTSTDLDGRLLDSTGTVISSSNYDNAHLNLKGEAAFSQTRQVGVTEISAVFGGTDDSPEGAGSVSYFYNPYDSSSYTFALWQASTRTNGVLRGRKGIAVLKSAERCTGVRVLTTSANVDEGKISVYGLASN